MIIHIPDNLWDRLRESAKGKDLSVAEIIQEAIEKWLEEEND